MRHFLPLFLIALAAPAQVISVGITGGVPLLPARSGYSSSYANPYLDTGRWTVGPTIDFHIVSGLSFEAGMLLRGYRIVGSYVISPVNSLPQLSTYREDARDFDFPLMLKYRFLSGPRRPFVKAGYVLTHESYDDFLSSAYILSGTGDVTLPGPPAGGTLHLSQVLQGGAAGIGEEFRFHKLRIAPEVRFTYLSYGSGSPQKELSALVSFLFH
jgi:hypothetical protein